MSKVTGGLLHVLRYARKASYSAPDGVTATYEQPDVGRQGAVYVNGKHFLTLIVDREGLYWDRPSPRVLQQIAERGISVEAGWTCDVEISGYTVDEAMSRNPHHKARHQSGIHVQMIQDQRVAFADKTGQWSVPGAHLHQVLKEFGVSPYDGWEPEIEDRSGDVAPVRTFPEILVHPKQSIPRSCYGSFIIVPIVPIEGEGPSTHPARFTVAGLTVAMLQKIVPHLPGLSNWRCCTNALAGQVCPIQIVNGPSAQEAAQSARLTLCFSSSGPQFPPDVPAQVVAEFVQVGYYCGLEGCAMRIEVSENGCARTITLLEKGWQQNIPFQ
jgi:hypothetical protein